MYKGRCPATPLSNNLTSLYNSTAQWLCHSPAMQYLIQVVQMHVYNMSVWKECQVALPRRVVEMPDILLVLVKASPQLPPHTNKVLNCVSTCTCASIYVMQELFLKGGCVYLCHAVSVSDLTHAAASAQVLHFTVPETLFVHA